MMRLQDLLAGCVYRLLQGSLLTEVLDVTDDSRNVKQNSLFICIRGTQFDGHDFLNQAIDSGASVVFVDDIFAAENQAVWQRYKSICFIAVTDMRKTAAIVADRFFKHPSGELHVIGITGTKGKTTTVYMIRHMLEMAGYKTGILGTIDYSWQENTMAAGRTTPEAITIQRYLREMADGGCEYVVMEVSSQGLKLHRTDCIDFEIGIFTNLGQDHIGPNEHADMADYAACKSRLFRQCTLGIGNIDDAWYARIFDAATCKIQTFSCEQPSDFTAGQMTYVNRHGKLGMLFMVNQVEYAVSVPGIFSVENALAAIAVGTYYGIAQAVMRAALQSVSVPGRVEIVPVDLPFRVVIDYAHNALSLKNILMTMRRYHPNRLAVLFGCGGGRSKTRRQQMGAVAGKYADMTVITSDNVRDEPPEEIIAGILEGMQTTQGEYMVIVDRYEAIRWLLSWARAGDIIVLAGKGHEKYQEIKGIQYPFDEREIVTEIAEESVRESVRESEFG